MIDDSLYVYMQEMLCGTPTAFHRHMYSKIDRKTRLAGVVRPRGIGKSTMLCNIFGSTKNTASTYTCQQTTFTLQTTRWSRPCRQICQIGRHAPLY